LDNILIHIGYHKTGTTWLQENLFVNSSTVFKPLNLNKNALSKKFVTGEDGYVLSPYDMNETAIRQELDLYSENDSNNVNVISHERLSGHPHSSGLDSKTISKRLHNFFPNAKVLIVIREQKSFILSIYLQYLAGGGVDSLKKYLNTKFDRKRFFFSPHHINYLPLIRYYIELFGYKNVCVLPYEMFAREPSLYFGKLGEFLGKDVEVDSSQLEIYANKAQYAYVSYRLRGLSYFLYSNSLNNYSSLKSKPTAWLASRLIRMAKAIIPDSWDSKLKRDMASYIQSWVEHRYENPNKDLEKLLGIDLAKYDYY